MSILISSFSQSTDDVRAIAGQRISNDSLDKLRFLQLGNRNDLVVWASNYELKICCHIIGREVPNMTTFAFHGNNAVEIVGNWNHHPANLINSPSHHD
jgi:hypothetical protein